MLHFSGGIENPLVLLMVFHVIIAGITLTKLECYLVAAFGVLVFSSLALAEMMGAVQHYTLQVVPHYLGAHGETAHAAHDPVYAVGLIVLIDGILFLTAAFVTTLSDRLREKEREQKSAQASMLRAGKLAAVGELAGQVAHEVNNPIAIINAKSRLLLSDRRDKMSDDVAEEIEKLIVLSSRVAEIAQGLLSYARPSTSEMTPQIVTPWVSRALNMVRQRAENSGIQIDEHLPDDLPETSVNAKEIEQIFLNLFLNALDAMPDGGNLNVYARTGDSDDREYVDVITEDSGSGIPLDVQDRIFEPFFTAKPEGQGTGLGLSVCHGLVSRYGGSIQVKSEEGKGTSMTVRLPVHQFDSD